MAQKRNRVLTDRLVISTTPRIVRDVVVLPGTDYFGKTLAEVAERLLSEKLRDVILQGWMQSFSSRPDVATKPLDGPRGFVVTAETRVLRTSPRTVVWAKV
jgi:hypothetical protein